MKVLQTFKIQLYGELDRFDQSKALEALSLHYLGDKEPNVYDELTGCYKEKYPDKKEENSLLKEATHKMYMWGKWDREVELLEDGTLKLKE